MQVLQDRGLLCQLPTELGAHAQPLTVEELGRLATKAAQVGSSNPAHEGSNKTVLTAIKDPPNYDVRPPPHAEAAEGVRLGAGAFDGLALPHAAPATSAGGGGAGTASSGRVGAAISRENLVHGLGAIRGRGFVEDDGLLTVFLDHLREIGGQLTRIGERQPIA
jgi:hypothetical protein